MEPNTDHVLVKFHKKNVHSQKAIITKESFHSVLAQGEIISQSKKHYSYFDTSVFSEDALLLKNKIRLRLENKGDKWKISFKAKDPSKKVAVYEIKRKISEMERLAFLAHGTLPLDTKIIQKLLHIGVNSEWLVYISETEVVKYEVVFKEKKYIFDATTYPDGTSIYEVGFSGLLDSEFTTEGYTGSKHKLLHVWSVIQSKRQLRLAI